MKSKRASKRKRPGQFAGAHGSAAGWTRINRSKLPKTGFVVAGSYRNGEWSTSSLSQGDGFPSWADDDRTHYFRLPKPPNDQAEPLGPA